MRRDSHQLKVLLEPGDLYLWDNFSILHGQEKIFNTSRMAIGQTVIEQVVSDNYTAVKMDWLRDHIGEHWLIQTPTDQMNNLVELVKDGLKRH